MLRDYMQRHINPIRLFGSHGYRKHEGTNENEQISTALKLLIQTPATPCIQHIFGAIYFMRLFHLPVLKTNPSPHY